MKKRAKKPGKNEKRTATFKFRNPPPTKRAAELKAQAAMVSAARQLAKHWGVPAARLYDAMAKFMVLVRTSHDFAAMMVDFNPIPGFWKDDFFASVAKAVETLDGPKPSGDNPSP